VTYLLDLEGVDPKSLNLRGTSPETIGRMSPSPNKSLRECLEIFTKEELLDTNNMWYCPRCKDHKMASRETLLNRVPPVLVVHLRRVKKVTQKYSNHFTKIVTKVDIPLEWDLAPFVLQPTSDYRYSLFGVVNHFGNLNGGHYTSFVLSEDGNWHLYDDETVRKVRPEEVSSAAAYVLFYKRIVVKAN